MSRSGYSFGDFGWSAICWRGAVNSAIRGKRGQAFLMEMLAALDAMPEKRLVSSALEKDGEFCALGTVGVRRGLKMGEIDPEDFEAVARSFGIAEALAREIEAENDSDGGGWRSTVETPEERWARMRAWVVEHLDAQPVMA